MDAIRNSVLSLCTTNNGFFKSEKQKQYLISELEESCGIIGFPTMYSNQAKMVAEWDDAGITMVKVVGKTTRVKFERLSDEAWETELKNRQFNNTLKVRINMINKFIDSLMKEVDKLRDKEVSTAKKMIYEDLAIEEFVEFKRGNDTAIENLWVKIDIYNDEIKDLQSKFKY